MFVDNDFFDHQNMRRLHFGIAGALALHALILVQLMLPAAQNTMAADTFSAPTNVSIRFVTPVKVPPKIVQNVVKTEPVQKPPVVKKIAKAVVQKPAAVPDTTAEMLNAIEPAAAPQNSIPVVSGASLKGRRIQPQYPKRSLRLRQEGVVWLRVLISESGARQNIKLYKPSEYALLNQAAIKAVKKWTFDPHVKNGRAIQSWVEIPIEFKIQ